MAGTGGIDGMTRDVSGGGVAGVVDAVVVVVVVPVMGDDWRRVDGFNELAARWPPLTSSRSEMLQLGRGPPEIGRQQLRMLALLVSMPVDRR
jgi:hypothetical protein